MILNGKEYRNVPLDFNAVCRLEEMGVNISDIDGHIMTAARAYAALCMRKPLSIAGMEIEAHVVAGGSMREIFDAFNSEVEKSGFFQALQIQSELMAMQEAMKETMEEAMTELIEKDEP